MPFIQPGDPHYHNDYPDHRISFQVHSTEHVGDQLIVSGTCSGGNIVIGDYFNIAAPLVFRSSIAPRSALNEPIHINLVVKAIESFRRPSDVMYYGLRGKLEVEGQGASYLNGIFLLLGD